MDLSYAHGATDVPLLGETIGANLERTAARVPDAEALVSRHQGERYTYAELNERVDALARGIVALGLSPGDRLGIWSPNCVEGGLLQFATARAGVILVNMNPAYRTSELEYALKQSDCRVLVSARSFKTSDYAAMIAEVAPPGLRTIFLGSPEWDALFTSDGDLPTGLQFDDPINIQY